MCMVIRSEVDVRYLNSTLCAVIFGDSLLLACNLWVWLACELQEPIVPSSFPTRARMTGVPLAVPQHQTQVLMFVQLLSVAQGMVFILNNFKYINPGRKKNSMVASDMIPSLGTCRDGTRRILELVRK